MIELHPITSEQVEAANYVMDAVCQELWGLTLEFVHIHYDPFEDMLNPQAYYFERNGTFLVLTDGERVIGTGGLGRLDDETAELKRIWLLREYRGRGLGRKMVEALLEFARAHGYRRVELMVATPELQPQAMSLYHSLGFCDLPHAKEDEDDTSLFMEIKFEPESEAADE
jgi:putative acetyltransferase